MSHYQISITRVDGKPVHLKPGSKGERDLVDAIVSATLAKGVGIFHSEDHVAQDLEDAIKEVLIDLKSEVEPY
jgi:hypothetical protein